MNHHDLSVRWAYLAVGVIGMLFAGVLYAWSILKSPLAADFGWGTSQLALNFTLAMCFFCIGGLLGAQMAKRAGHKVALLAAAEAASEVAAVRAQADRAGELADAVRAAALGLDGMTGADKVSSIYALLANVPV
ncbi:MAG: hypothetical protein IKB65_07090, partial [Ruminiclostridium sp.]|nr:hypothetical protein [Ruminiclostridium sp.]